LPAETSRVLNLRLCSAGEAPREPFGTGFGRILAQRKAEADDFFAARIPASLSNEEREVSRQAYAGLLWT
jgi:hypothetical protein